MAIKQTKINFAKKLRLWILNNLFNKEYCLYCGCNLNDVIIDGFDELEHHGTGQRKWCPDCGKPFHV